MASNYVERANGNGAAPDERSLRTLRSSFGIILAGLSVMFVLLVAVRFLMAGSQVGDISQFLGALVTAIALVGMQVGRMARRAAWDGQLVAAKTRLGWATVLALAAVAGVVIQWIGLAAQSLSFYNQTYYTLSGFWVLYALVSAFVLFAARQKIRRQGATVHHGWNVEASTLFWSFSVLAWVLMYVILYFF
jgi:heme/copper-type cytochrome/quinol oxidase subunit 3